MQTSRLELTTSYPVKVHSHGAKANVKAKKIKEQSEEMN